MISDWEIEQNRLHRLKVEEANRALERRARRANVPASDGGSPRKKRKAKRWTPPPIPTEGLPVRGQYYGMSETVRGWYDVRDENGKPILNSGALHLWLAYRSYLGGGGEDERTGKPIPWTPAWVSDDTLCKHLVCNRRTLQRNRQLLIKAGYLIQTLRGPQVPLHYATTPREQDEAEKARQARETAAEARKAAEAKAEDEADPMVWCPDRQAEVRLSVARQPLPLSAVDPNRAFEENQERRRLQDEQAKRDAAEHREVKRRAERWRRDNPERFEEKVAPHLTLHDRKGAEFLADLEVQRVVLAEIRAEVEAETAETAESVAA